MANSVSSAESEPRDFGSERGSVLVDLNRYSRKCEMVGMLKKLASLQMK